MSDRSRADSDKLAQFTDERFVRKNLTNSIITELSHKQMSVSSPHRGSDDGRFSLRRGDDPTENWMSTAINHNVCRKECVLQKVRAWSLKKALQCI